MFHCDQILTTNILVLFRRVKQIREVLRFHFNNTWTEQLFCLLMVQSGICKMFLRSVVKVFHVVIQNVSGKGTVVNLGTILFA